MVHWDYITYSDVVDDHLNRIGNTVFNRALEIFNKYAGPKSHFVSNGRLIWFKDMGLSEARLAAAELYDLIVWALLCAKAASARSAEQNLRPK